MTRIARQSLSFFHISYEISDDSFAPHLIVNPSRSPIPNAMGMRTLIGSPKLAPLDAYTVRVCV